MIDLRLPEAVLAELDRYLRAGIALSAESRATLRHAIRHARADCDCGKAR